MTPPDPTDRRLLSLLQQDARMPVVALAAELGISRATVSARARDSHGSGWRSSAPSGGV